MIGVGAVGTGIEDSKNLSSVFIILSIFPIYLLQSLITQPDSLIAKVFSYLPFTSFMTLLLRNSFGSLTSTELITGVGVSILYTVVALLLSYKLFELGCLMYNRRPTVKEMIRYIK
jgi:ABC-2 type transport system permease protein